MAPKKVKESTHHSKTIFVENFNKAIMNGALNFPIENLRIWRCRKWVQYKLKLSNLTLRIQHDQLLITTENKILESLNVNGKLKGILKDDVLILVINMVGQEVRKIKFQIGGNISTCLQELSARFSVVTYGSVISQNKITTKYRKLEDVLKDVLEGKVKLNPCHSIPAEYKNFIKLCLIDPMFPQVVIETEKILNSQILSKKP